MFADPKFVVGLALALACIALIAEYFGLRARLIAYKILLSNAPVASMLSDDLPDDLRAPILDAVSEDRFTALRIKSYGPWRFRREFAFTFDGASRITGVKVTDDKQSRPKISDPDEKQDRPLKSKDIVIEGPTVRVPTVKFRRGCRFKLVVTHQGKTEISPVIEQPAGYRNRIVDDTRVPRLTPGRVLRACCALLASSLITMFLLDPGQPLAAPADCATGTLTLVGSTAFTAAATGMADTYMAMCRGATILIETRGTLDGIQQLEQTGSGRAGSIIAMSDGRDTGDEASFHIHGTPLAILIYAVVVNKGTGIHNLSTAQLRGIYRGDPANWAKLGGAAIPISIVGRDGESGSRLTFERRVLGFVEPQLSSNDCIHKDRSPRASLLRCERTTTKTLISAVSQVPGAIGYADMSSAAQYDQIERVTIDNTAPDISTVERAKDPYPFWTTEYFYSYGMPPAGSIASRFLSYVLKNPIAKDTMRANSEVPCKDQGQDLSALCSRY